MQTKNKTHLYPKNVENKLGFDRIKEQIENNCNSQLGKHELERIVISSDNELVELVHNQLTEFRTILTSDKIQKPSTSFAYLAEHIKKLKIGDSVLTEEQLLEIKSFVSQYGDLLKILKKYREVLANLFEL